MVVVVAALGLALYLQGAYTTRSQVLVAVLLVVGALLTQGRPALVRRDLPVALAAAAFAGWALVDGALSGRLAGGADYAVLIASLVAVTVLCRCLDPVHLVAGLVAVCCTVALLGWYGVLVHHRVLGFHGPGMWRASATLTYPNATAAVLAMSALMCVALRSRGSAPALLGAAAAVLLTGLLATLSRAGLGGFAVGLLVVVLCTGWRPALRATIGPAVGAVVATVGLLPSVTAATPSVGTIVLAVVGLLAGVVIGTRDSGRVLFVAAATCLIGGTVVLAAQVGGRFTLDSPDRWGSFEAAWRVFAEHPLAGAGPGLDQLTLARPAGSIAIYRYAHNEYLQVLAELGAIGGLLLVALLYLLARRFWPHRRADGYAVGAAAALAALIVHAGFDFVWHIPALPLLAAAMAGTTNRTERNTP